MALFLGPVVKDATEVFNMCARYLAREQREDMTLSDAWRFPWVAPYADQASSGRFNEVTFIYRHTGPGAPSGVSLVGSFLPLYETIPLTPVLFDEEATGLFYVSLVLPIGHGYRYRYRVDGDEQLDEINPQRVTLKNGRTWSFFFTDNYNYSQEFEEWEIKLLYRLTEHILPFRTEDAQNFIDRFYETQSRSAKEEMPVYRLDQSIGEVNFITNLLAREERHHLIDYKICLGLIDAVLRQRNPYINSWKVSSEMIQDLYNEMATNNVRGWDFSQYGNPQYFLKLLRRHCVVGSFSHPRYGGNIGGAGWNYLKERYAIKDDDARVCGSYFNWDRAIEKPLGGNADYLG